MAESYTSVMGRLKKLASEGGSREDAVKLAEASGWKWDELKAAKSAKPGESYVAPLVQGVTFGFGDEIAAGISSISGGASYDEELARNRAILKRASTDRPIPSAATELAGAIVPGVAAAPAAIGRGVASTIARSSGLGAAEGAAYGAGTGEGAGNRAERAGWGAATGGIVGAAAPAVVETGRAGIRAARSLATPDAAAAGEIRRALARDGMTPQELATKAGELAERRPGAATVADAGGENLKGLMERVAQTPGAGRSKVVPFLEGRQKAQLGRFDADLKAMTGSDQKAFDLVEQTIAERSEAAKPLYQEAMAFPIEQVPEVGKAFAEATATGWGRSILNSGDFRRTLQTEYGVADVTKAPMMMVIDAWKKSADDMAKTAARKGRNNQARVIGDMVDRIVPMLDKANPAYGEARRAWAGPSRYVDAVEEGGRILGMKADEVDRFMARASDAEKEAFRTGAVSSLGSKMAGDPAKMADYTKYLRSPEMRRKVAALMPDAERRAKWGAIVDDEVGMSEMTGRSLGGSATARRLAEREDVTGNAAGDILIDMATGTPAATFISRIMRGSVGRARDTARSRVDNSVAIILTDPDVARALSELRVARRPPIGYGEAPSRAGPALGGPMGATIAAGIAPVARPPQPSERDPFDELERRRAGSAAR